MAALFVFREGRSNFISDLAGKLLPFEGIRPAWRFSMDTASLKSEWR